MDAQGAAGMKAGRALLGIAFAGLALSSAQAACPERLGVRPGDTLSAIAQACGISVETLRAANPGVRAERLRPGQFLAVPPPALPSPQGVIGRPALRVAPPLVPPATITPPSTTVIPPPPPALQHPQVPPGFDTRPRHMRPRPPVGWPENVPYRPPFP